MILCDSKLLGQTCNTTILFPFLNTWKILGDMVLLYSHDLNTWIETITEEVIQFIRANMEQQKTLNRVNSFLEQLCSGN